LTAVSIDYVSVLIYQIAFAIYESTQIVDKSPI
jgi:hypothetical protein